MEHYANVFGVLNCDPNLVPIAISNPDIERDHEVANWIFYTQLIADELSDNFDNPLALSIFIWLSQTACD
jgi:hypothetical protein